MKYEALQYLGGIAADRFLAKYWQKRPLLIRNAFSDFTSPLSPDELAGLACDDGVESRLIRETAAPPHWLVRHGPFSERDFAALPATHWTLLVQDVEKHLPELDALLEPFRFIPDWRIDDLMISYAPAHGSVGPHIDAYDVFLLQARGRRRWQINTTPAATALLPDIDLKVLRDFAPEQEWVLEPGDMLYLPPGVAHHGVALDACMTFSIGFRAPSVREMLGDFAELIVQQIPEDLRYADPELHPEEAADGRLSSAALRQARELLRGQLQPGDAVLDHWFGRFITEPKHWLRPAPPAAPLDAGAFAARLEAGGVLFRSTQARCAWLQLPDGGATLFANGTAHDLSRAAAGLAPLLCGNREFSFAALKDYLKDRETGRLLAGLYNEGCLYFLEHDHD